MNQRNLEPTRILDYGSPVVRDFAEAIPAGLESVIGFLQTAHALVADRVSPIYTVKERQPVSITIAKRRGSCSQRLACLEALARSRRIGTRVRALWVSGKFWRSRFPLSRVFIPKRILLAWPQFEVTGRWLGVEELFGPLEERAREAVAFTNDTESLFEAVRSTAVDFDGRTRTCSSVCDLSGFVAERGAVFDKRDDLFEQHGSFEGTWRGSAFELFYAGRSSA